MFVDLETERLILKCIDYSDTEFFYKEFSDDDVNRYLYDAEPCASVEEAKEWIDFYLEPEPRNHHRWVIELKSTGEKIGTCGFHCWNTNDGTVEIGYDLMPQYRRNGFMSEAVRELTAFADNAMNVSTIYAHIAVGNDASIKTALKAGFSHTGEQYYEAFHRSKYLHDVYALYIHRKEISELTK